MPAVEVRLLGPLEVGVSGRHVKLTGRKRRALLTLLALRSGEVVSIDRIVEELWRGTPPKAAVGSLQNLVSDLRKALGAQTLVTRSPGYVLEVDADDVDVHRFERLAREAQAASSPAERARGLRDALALWRGEPLADLAFEPFAQPEIARLEELRSSVREELFEAELELGDHGRLVAELEAYVAEHPLRERPRGQLILALYRSGRQADALGAYRATREALVEELGVEPSPKLQRLEQAILRHDPSLSLERPTRPEPVAPARRKTVTILFADVVDSSGLAAGLDPEVLRGVMDWYFDIVRSVIERHGGVVEKFIGDAAMAVFGVPEVHEDDALRAVRAAQELHEALSSSEHGQGAVRIHVGVNTGEVLATDPVSSERFATGSAVVLAQRIQHAALPGETLVGEVTRRLVHGDFETEPVEPLDLGRSFGRVRAFRVLAPRTFGAGVRLSHAAPLVGRAAELAFLRTALADVESERTSRVVRVLGDAGIGKTRLTAELVSAATDAQVLVGRCVPYGEGATYLPLAEALRGALPHRVKATVVALLAGDEQAELVGQRVAELTGDAVGSAAPAEVFWAVRRLIEALAAKRPVVLVLEDVHWAEPTLLDLLDYLAAWVVEAPILILCIARPDVLEKRPGWAEGSLVLEPLSTDDSVRLVTELTEVSDQVRAHVVEVAEGNPLFLEQLLAYVLEIGDAAPLDALPPTVDALLSSRIDRLDDEERALVERAAIVGKEFRSSEVRHLSPPSELAGLDGRLVSVARKSFIRPIRSASPDAAFRFHHALIRDAAYNGMTKKLRAELHERHADWLEQREDGLDEIIGGHLERACRYATELRAAPRERAGALGLRASVHLGRAGHAALARGDMPAAANLLERAAEIGPSDRAPVGEFLCSLATALLALVELEAAGSALDRAEAWAKNRPESVVQARAAVERARVGLVAGKLDVLKARRLAEASLPALEQRSDDLGLARGWLLIGDTCNTTLEMNALERAEEQALAYARRAGSSVEEAEALFWIGLALYMGPRPVAVGIERLGNHLAHANGLLEEGHALVHLSLLHAMNGEGELARSEGRRAREIYTELGYRLWADATATARGLVETFLGDLDAAEVEFRAGFDGLEELGERTYSRTIAAFLSRVLCDLDRYEEALSFAELSQEAGTPGDLWNSVISTGARARILATSGDYDAAVDLAQNAVNLISKTDALPLRADAYLDQAAVMRLAARQAEERVALDTAVTLFEEKGNVASAARAGALLRNLVVVN